MTDTRAFEDMELTGWRDPDIARGYAESFDRATRAVAERLADSVRAGPGLSALDLCTGHGVVAAELLARGATVTGLDFSEAMIALARENAPGATFLQGDAMAMSFADGSFEGITIGFGVPHFPDPASGLAEAARVLKPGGRIAFSIWEGKGSDGAMGWLFEAVGNLGDPTVTLPDGPDAHLLAQPQHARSIAGDAGFSEIGITRIATELALPRPEALFDAFDRGAVRARSLLGGQPDDRREAIRANLTERARAMGIEREVGLCVPVPSVIVSGIRV